jgi:hypothetical protein
MANIDDNYVGEREDVVEEVDEGAERLEEGTEANIGHGSVGAGVGGIDEPPYPCPFSVPCIG